MGGLFGWLCLYLPWHRWRKLRDLSVQAELCECTHCGRRWAMNNHVCAILPWDTVKHFYAQRETERFGRPICD
jgi:hypothetical protein